MICSNCKRCSEEFELDNGYKAYWFCVPKESNDPEYLLSDLSYSFLACCDKEPEESDKYDYWCVNCIESIIDRGGE